MTEDCSEALIRPLSHPPRIGTHLTRRAVIDASLHSSELASATLNLHHVQYRLVFVGMFIVVCAVITHRALSPQVQTDDEDIDVNDPIIELDHPWTNNANARNKAVSELTLSSQVESEAIKDPVTTIAASMDIGPSVDGGELRRRPVAGSSDREKLEAKFKLYAERQRKVVLTLGNLIAISSPGRLHGQHAAPEDNHEVGVVFSQIRRFVIVGEDPNFQTGLPVSNYGGKRVATKKLTQKEQMAHAMVYSKGKHAAQLDGEPYFTKSPICIDTSISGYTLPSSSRLCYSKPPSLDCNVRVRHLGHVVQEHIPRLVLDYEKENISTLREHSE